MCYHGQGYEVPLVLTGKGVTRKEYSNLIVNFEEAYKERYSITKISNHVDVTSFKVNVSSKSSALPRRIIYTVPSRPKSSKEAFDPDSMKFRTFKLLNRYSMKAGDSVKGPALIQEVESTTVLPSKSSAGIDESGNILVNLVG